MVSGGDGVNLKIAVVMVVEIGDDVLSVVPVCLFLLADIYREYEVMKSQRNMLITYALVFYCTRL
ncbi:hypothetical protein Hanom_Chr07g00616291 [Helianthus anomalus]